MNDTIEQAMSALPNGLHDAKLVAIRVDYARRAAAIDLLADISSTPAPRYSPVTLHLHGLHMLSIDPGILSDAPSRIDVGEGLGPSAPAANIPAHLGTMWIFVDPWNAFVRAAFVSCEIVSEAPPAEE